MSGGSRRWAQLYQGLSGGWQCAGRSSSRFIRAGLARMFDCPGMIFAISFVILLMAVFTGTYFARARTAGKLDEDERSDLGVILTAALTLLGLIIGFTFSMAITRYDQRKNLEAAEANAIGTEIARASLLPLAQAA